MSLADIIQKGWDALLVGDYETVLADYTEDVSFIMPGQDDVIHGPEAIRGAFNMLDKVLPPGFEITSLRNIEGTNEVVTIVEWKSDKVSASQLAILFKFRGEKVSEERWFLDTEQWKSAF